MFLVLIFFFKGWGNGCCPVCGSWKASNTPLQCAAEARKVQVASLLIARGAKANVKSLKVVVSLDLDRLRNQPSLVQPLCHEKERA
jgi:ankyrin repeat protein